MKKVKGIFFLVFLISGLPAFGQATFESQIIIDTFCVGKAIVQTTDGGYLIGGSHSDRSQINFPFLLKTGLQGNIRWIKKIGTDSIGYVFSLAKSKTEESYFIGGSIYLDTQDWIFTMKIDSAGNTLWTKASNISYFGYQETLTASNDGGCIVAGIKKNNSAPYIIKYQKDGTVEWTRTIPPGNTYTQLTSIIQLKNGSYLITGDAYPTNGNESVSLLNLRSDGSVKWSKLLYDAAPILGISATPTKDGGFALCGDAQGSRLYAAKVDSNGLFLWGSMFLGQETQSGYSIAEDLNGNLIVNGVYSAFSNDHNVVADSIMVMQLAGNGTFMKAVVISHNSESIPGNMVISSDGSIILTGSSGDFTKSYDAPHGVLLKKLGTGLSGCNLKGLVLTEFPYGKIGDLPDSIISDTATMSIDLKTGSNLNSTLYDLCSNQSVSSGLTYSSCITVSSNPVTGESPLSIKIENLQAGVYTLRCCDIFGNTIAQQQINLTGEKQDLILDIRKCVPGVYFVELKDERGIAARTKFVKE
jgi:hypothetical protein